MYKKITQAIALVFATGMILSGPASATPNGITKPMVNEKAKENQNQNQVEEKEQKQNKGQLQQLKSVDKQLDKIEEKINHYRTKLTDIQKPEDDIDELEDELEDEQELEEEALEDEEEAVESKEETADDAAAEKQTSDGTVEETDTEDDSVNKSLDGNTETTGQASSGETTEENSEGINEVDSEKPTEVEDAEQAVEEQEELEDETESVDSEDDAEDEDIEEELQNNQGYLGKFRALQNRLNAVTNRLDTLSSNGVDSTLLTERYNRIEALNNEVSKVTSSIQQIEKKIKDKIETDDTILEKTPVEDVPLTKEWNITFNNSLNKAALSDLDIVVLNQEQGLVETTISYSETEKKVILTPLQPYKAGETYTLYIDNELTSENGLSLKNSVKMEFTVK